VQAHYTSLGLPFRPRFYPVFQRLLQDGPATVSQIALASGATQPAATQTINELKHLGLIAVEAGDDRRERRVTLTAKGTKMADELRPFWLAVERAAAALDDELPAGLRATLKAALAALERRSFGERIGDELSSKEN
jgi:DNA-binding MarR family transcriptional regulator